MYAPIFSGRPATVALGTPAARALALAHEFRARRPCGQCGSRRASDWRGNGTNCLDCGAWEPPAMGPVTYRASSDPSRRVTRETHRPSEASRSRLGTTAGPVPSQTRVSHPGHGALAEIDPTTVATLKLTAIDALGMEELVALLAHIAIERDRLGLLERAILNRLHTILPSAVLATAPLLTAREAAHRLGMSIDFIRDHGHRLGIAVPLGDGVTRYDPTALEELRQRRAQRRPPRD